MVRKAAIRTKGGSGPSGMDAEGWRRIIASNQFGATYSDLRKAFAEVFKKLCTKLDENNTIEDFLANHLIELLPLTIKTIYDWRNGDPFKRRNDAR